MNKLVANTILMTNRKIQIFAQQWFLFMRANNFVYFSLQSKFGINV